MKNITLSDAFKIGKKILDQTDYADGYIDARVLLCKAAGITTEEFYAYRDSRIMTPGQMEIYNDMLKLRIARMPVAYIVRNREFMGLEFYVDRSVLIPRPATETLVEKALEFLKNSNFTQHLIADVGCGSGNIALSVAYYNLEAKIWASDTSAESLAVARKNVNRFDKLYPGRCFFSRIHLLMGNLMNPFPETLQNSFQVVLSNPPYVTASEWEDLMDGVRLYEPRDALVPPDGPRQMFENLASQAYRFLSPGGAFICEIGSSQAEMVTGIFRENDFAGISVIKDLEGFDRVIYGDKK